MEEEDVSMETDNVGSSTEHQRKYEASQQQQPQIMSSHLPPSDTSASAINHPETEPCQCSSCGCNWLEGKYTLQCPECDGFSMTRPCRICNGSCGVVWKRDVKQSNRTGCAYWSGVCDNQREARRRYELNRVHQITDAMDTLNTK